MRNFEIEPHLEPSQLILYKGLDKTVKLFKFVGDVESEEMDRVKDYFYYITPDFALNNRLIGFDDYSDIGYYCQENDVWIVEELMEVPLELTIGFEKQALKDEKDRRERAYLNYVRQQKLDIAKIDEAFMDATYPNRRHDHLLDMINDSRVYVPEGRRFFSEYGVMYIIRERGDYMARLSNSEYDNDLCNTTGIVRGVYCYTKYRTKIAKLINETCTDETEAFRRLYSRKLSYKGYVEPKPPKPCRPYRHNHVDCKFDKKGLY